MEDKARIGSVYYNRGVVGIITVEAIRTAQAKYGKGQTMNGEQMRWGFRASQHRCQAPEGTRCRGFMPDLKVSCL